MFSASEYFYDLSYLRMFYVRKSPPIAGIASKGYTEINNLKEKLRVVESTYTPNGQ